MMRLSLCFFLSFTVLSAQEPLRGFPQAAAATERDWEQKAMEMPEAARVGLYIEHMAAKPHLAGTPASKEVADYTVGLLREWGLDTHIEEFEALLPTPRGRLVEMLSPTHFKAKLAEPPVTGDRTSASPDSIPSFNAYSGSADVTAPLVYVNFGVPADYDTLKRMGIDVTGKIVIARYGGSWRGVKPKVAQEHGAIGCLIYSDPHEDGYFQGDVYPKGPYRPSDGVQRGSVMDMAIHPGDPLSPGWASEKGSKRLTLAEQNVLMKIPVLPISYGDAQPLLAALDGPVAPTEWRGALPITYHMGPGTRVRLRVDMDNSTHPLHDVIVKIPGSEFPDQWILYGNHHDAWVDGADDPLSGAASLLETARTLAQLTRLGWKPKRTILLALWDGEEYGLIGSTEWAEKHAAELEQKLVVYINSDSNSNGHLSVGGSHTLEEFVHDVARDLKDPVSGKPLLDTANQLSVHAAAQSGRAPTSATPGDFRIEALGSGSDYTSFLQHLGIASLNIGFGGEVGSGGIYHSIYDSWDWYRRFGDPGFPYGRALSQVTTTALLRLADAPLLPFEFSHFAATLDRYVGEIETLRGARERPKMDHVKAALLKLKQSAADFQTAYEKALPTLGQRRPAQLAQINQLLYQSERKMTIQAGLPGREWFRHSIYAPGAYTGYAVKTLPGVREALEADKLDESNQQAQQLTQVLQQVTQQIEESARQLKAM
jgi:N-acetylated-alpha-linked acidic dipeptidase